MEKGTVKHVFIIGSKGIPASYGGYETFVDELTSRHFGIVRLQYHVACKDGEKEFFYNGARCFPVKTPKIGKGAAVVYDVRAMKSCLSYIRENKIENAVIYVLACRMGWFFKKLIRRAHRLGACVFVNPDGHEWKRKKWNAVIRKYWKFSEKKAVRYADLVVCDSKNIQAYILQEYARFSPKTVFIPYGADIHQSKDEKGFLKWSKGKKVTAHGYYLVVGRFVPENNIELILRAFIASKTRKKLLLITNAGGKFLERLKKTTGFDRDGRIVFGGTVYDKELLTAIRKNAFAYIHGHEVGGTNPSLLESLVATDVNLLLDVCFNREVAKSGALYFKKDEQNLTHLIEQTEMIPAEKRNALKEKARARIEKEYSWDKIAKLYRELFLNGEKS